MQWTVVHVAVLLALASPVLGAGSGGCAAAIYVAPPYTGQVVFGSTVGAAAFPEYQCGLNTTYTSTGTAFYVVTPTIGSQFNVSTCWPNTLFDTALAMYVGDDCNDLECAMEGNGNSPCTYSTDAASLSIVAEASTYWVMVTGLGQQEGQFELSFNEEVIGSTPEDGCDNAISIQGPFTTPLTLVGSVTAPANGQPCGSFVNSTVAGNWIQIYPTTGATVTVTTCTDYAGTLTDTIIAVLIGSCTSLQCQFTSDNSCVSYSSALSTVVFTAWEDYYYVYVTGGGSSTGTYELIISEVVTMTTLSSTPVPSYSPTMTRAPSGSPTVTYMGSASAPPSASPTPSIFSYHTPNPSTSRTPYPSSYPSAYPSASSTVGPTPPHSGSGDSCSDAVYLPGQGQYVGFNLAGGEYATDICGTSSNSRTQWFVIEPPLGQNVIVSTCMAGTEFDTIIAAFSECNTVSCQVGNDDDYACNSGSTKSTIEFYAAHEVYYLVVAGYHDDDESSFALTIEYEENGAAYPTAPSGNGIVCSEAVFLPGPGVYPGFSNMEGDYLVDLCGRNTDSRGQWFYIEPPTATTVTVSTCGSGTNFDTVIGVFTGCNVSECQVSGDDDTDCHVSPSFTTVQFYATQDIYYIAVAGYGSASGVMEISVAYDDSGNDPNNPHQSGDGNNCSQAIYLPGEGHYPGFSTYEGDYEVNMCGLLTDSRSVWFYFEPPMSSTVTVSTCAAGTDFDTVVGIFTDCHSGSCQIGEDDDSDCDYSTLDSTVTFFTTSSVYYVGVAGYESATGTIELIIEYD